MRQHLSHLINEVPFGARLYH